MKSAGLVINCVDETCAVLALFSFNVKLLSEEEKLYFSSAH